MQYLPEFSLHHGMQFSGNVGLRELFHPAEECGSCGISAELTLDAGVLAAS